MQPAANPDDIHTILSRFQTWAEQPANGNGNGHKNGAGPLEGVREIPYEEAMRQHRNRRVAQGQRRAVSPRASVPPVPLREPDLQAQREPVAEVSSPAAVDLAAAKIAEVVAQSKFVPAPLLGNDELLVSAPVAIGVVAEPIATVAKARAPRAKRAPTAAAAETEKSSLIPAIAISQNIADAPLDSPKPLPRPIPRNASPKRRTAPAPTTTAAAPIPAPTIRTLSAGRARPPMKSAVPRMPKPVAKAEEKNAAPRKSAAPPAVKLPIAKQPQFRQVLTKKVLQAERSSALKDASKKDPTPDRTQRITTRFSPAEQHRIEKQAAVAGLTVSAWLRHCALSSGTTAVQPKKPQAVAAKSGSKRRSVVARNPARQALFSQPTNSALGNWLTLLRQRFLSSPMRFSEQA
ncbi:MAG: hypothetical protein WA891_20785 [Acidobacteriaceae bacterium]